MFLKNIYNETLFYSTGLEASKITSLLYVSPTRKDTQKRKIFFRDFITALRTFVFDVINTHSLANNNNNTFILEIYPECVSIQYTFTLYL